MEEQNHYDLRNPEVMALSEAIDELIVLFMKKRTEKSHRTNGWI